MRPVGATAVMIVQKKFKKMLTGGGTSAKVVSHTVTTTLKQH
jgi:hypothetical protein